MVRKLFLMLGLLSVFGMSFDIRCDESWFEWITFRRKRDIVETRAEKKNAAKLDAEPSEVTSSSPGLMKQAVCSVIVLPVTLAQSVRSALTFQIQESKDQEQKKVEPWFWQKWSKPAAIDVAVCSVIPWYGHAAHGYYHRLKNMNNEDLRQYSTMWQRVKAFNFETFSKWHPIQSMKGNQRMMLPLIGPMIAVHATGLVYHGLMEHTYASWKAQQISS